MNNYLAIKRCRVVIIALSGLLTSSGSLLAFAEQDKGNSLHLDSGSSEPSKIEDLQKLPLQDKSGQGIYRFYWGGWIRGGACIIVSFDERGVATLVGLYTRFSGHRREYKHFTLSPAESKKLLELISEIGFWTASDDQNPQIVFDDGSIWAIEGRLGNKERNIASHCPTQQKQSTRLRALIELGQAFAKAADFDKYEVCRF